MTGYILKPPFKHTNDELCKASVFLGGTIEQGKAPDWQHAAAATLFPKGWLVYNPRRDNWDASWEQTPDNPEFVAQVEWELEALERAAEILFYFHPGTLSPISLLELGMYAQSASNVKVCCPAGFWRRGNVQLVCQRYKIRMYDTLEKMLDSYGSVS